MKKTFIRSVLTSIAVLASICAFMPLNAFAQIVVTAEGAYTAGDLAIYIYADIGPEMRSAGIKLTYNTGELTAPVVEQNRKDWFLGEYIDDSQQGLPYPNGVDISTPGEVVIILGKLDTSEDGAHTSEGVNGSRVLLGKVRFTRTAATIPYVPTGLGLALGRDGKFANFVDISGNECDADPTNPDDPDACAASVSFGTITVRERGDANADTNITNQDMGRVRNLILQSKYVVYADANDDGQVSNQDMGRIRNIILGNI